MMGFAAAITAAGVLERTVSELAPPFGKRVLFGRRGKGKGMNTSIFKMPAPRAAIN
jgi:hypothetical protein